MSKPLQIKLPVCPECDQVSAMSDPAWSGKVTCGGPKEAPHKRTKMLPRLFIEKGPQK